jgi:glutamine cyclotransferase
MVPEIKKVKVLKVYPHDKQAYTQGLFYENGFLYEGTGQWGQSSLRKVKPQTYEIIQSYNLPDDVFGEGIVSYGDEIIQLTWQSREAFVYDKKTFKLKNRFTYGTEGWGITNLGENLVMSDGSNVLYVLSPENFTVLDKIEVYDNNGPVRYLNELENIDGKIYANVYQTDTIVVIEPTTGKVTRKIDCSGLLSEDDKFPGIDVLNGIAYDKLTGTKFITGKNWPKLFVVDM